MSVAVASSPVSGATQHEPLRVMVVDDEAPARNRLRDLIGDCALKMPIEIAGEADNGRRAIELVEAGNIDVVLLDIRLPDGSGLDACRQILKERPDTNVLILTSFSNDSLVYEAVIAGAKGYLMKEVDPSGLMEAIENAAAGRSVLTPDVTARVLRLLRGGDVHAQLSAAPEFTSNSARRMVRFATDVVAQKKVA